MAVGPGICTSGPTDLQHLHCKVINKHAHHTTHDIKFTQGWIQTGFHSEAFTKNSTEQYFFVNAYMPFQLLEMLKTLTIMVIAT